MDAERDRDKVQRLLEQNEGQVEQNEGEVESNGGEVEQMVGAGCPSNMAGALWSHSNPGRAS